MTEENDETSLIARLDNTLSKIGIKKYEIEKDYSLKRSPTENRWDIKQSGSHLGSLFELGFIVIEYSIERSYDNNANYSQIQSSLSLVEYLKEKHCNQFIEIPSRIELRSRLEDTIRRSSDIISKLEEKKEPTRLDNIKTYLIRYKEKLPFRYLW